MEFNDIPNKTILYKILIADRFSHITRHPAIIQEIQTILDEKYNVVRIVIRKVLQNSVLH